jgi:hypothetical protein
VLLHHDTCNACKIKQKHILWFLYFAIAEAEPLAVQTVRVNVSTVTVISRILSAGQGCDPTIRKTCLLITEPLHLQPASRCRVCACGVSRQALVGATIGEFLPIAIIFKYTSVAAGIERESHVWAMFRCQWP